jgi:amidophosphoribosyltransferase
VGCPPIIAPCYLGIDMKTRDQFIANGKDVGQISKEIGADTVRYLTIDEMVKAIGQKREDLCVGCLTGYYPLKIPGERERFQRTLFDTKCG